MRPAAAFSSSPLSEARSEHEIDILETTRQIEQVTDQNVKGDGRQEHFRSTSPLSSAQPTPADEGPASDVENPVYECHHCTKPYASEKSLKVSKCSVNSTFSETNSYVAPSQRQENQVLQEPPRHPWELSVVLPALPHIHVQEVLRRGMPCRFLTSSPHSAHSCLSATSRIRVGKYATSASRATAKSATLATKMETARLVWRHIRRVPSTARSSRDMSQSW